MRAAVPQDTGDLTCPPVTVRAGASTYAVAAPGKQPVGNDLRFQATISKMARECSVNGGVITARIGIQGRVIAGPAGAPPSVQVPIRVAVVQGGVSEKTIATKAYQTTVTMTEGGSEPFTLVAEDLTYPAPSGAVGDSYIFYIGFDPQALKPERPAPKKTRAQKAGQAQIKKSRRDRLAPALIGWSKALSSAWREPRRCPWRAGRRRPSP